MKRIGYLDRDRYQPLYVDGLSLEAEAFARRYRDAIRDANIIGSDGAVAAAFTDAYARTVERSGFAGSGTSLFTDRQTGATYRVERIANGRSFWGTDVIVTVAS